LFTMVSMVRYAVSFCALSAHATSVKPNVVVFFVDDMGYGDVGAYGAPTTKTPQIDRLASEGMIFTQWYTPHGICTPSRAAMMTGRLPIRYGMASKRDGSQGVMMPRALTGLPENEVTLPQILKSEGYGTAMVGKWHLGHHKQYLPTSRGFDYYLGLTMSVDQGFTFGNTSWLNENVKSVQVPLPLMENENIIEQPVDLSKLTDRYTEKVVQFVEKHAAANIPFFIYYAFSHVHHPQFASAEFCGRSQRGVFGDSVEEVDTAVGQVMHKIHQLRIGENTLVIFTSDNGAPDSLQHLPTGVAPSPMVGSNGPFIGAKTSTWEGGVRVPGVVWWPRHVHASRNLHTVSHLDVFATVLEVAGIQVPSNTDSISMRPLLFGESAGIHRQTHFLYRGAVLGAVRHKKWKLHLDTTKPTVLGQDIECYAPYGPLTNPLLFQIEHDPSERFPVVDRPDVVAEILELVKKHHEDVGVPPEGILDVKGDDSAQLCCDWERDCYCSLPTAPDAVLGFAHI